MVPLTLPKGTEHALRELTGEARPDVALLLVMRDAVTLRLERMAEELRRFEEKYGMTWDAFHARWQDAKREEDYAWEAEREYLEWEALWTRRQRLQDVSAWLA